MTHEEVTRRLEAYLALRIALGFAMHQERYILEDFLRYLHAHGTPSPLRAQTAIAWACQPAPRRGRNTYAQRLTVVRGFLRHLRAAEPDTEVPDHALLGAAHRRPTPYLLDEGDIVRLMDAAMTLRPGNALRPLVYGALIGLLSATGLRIGEALSLTTADVLLETEPPRLRIADAKFGKSRWVPLHASTADMLRGFARERQRRRVDALTDIFFASERGAQIDRSAAWQTLRRLSSQVGLDPQGARRRLTWHSFRHTFAVRRLTEWYEQGEDVATLIPNLSVYLGHVCPKETYWYLTATPALLRAAADAFERFAGEGGER